MLRDSSPRPFLPGVGVGAAAGAARAAGTADAADAVDSPALPPCRCRGLAGAPVGRRGGGTGGAGAAGAGEGAAAGGAELPRLHGRSAARRFAR